MIFHSLDFLVFFVVALLLYWRLPRRGQNVLLLIASYFFYGYVHPWFLMLVAATTIVDYWAGRGMASDPARKKLYLVLSLCVNLGMLGFFKYFNFFAANAHAALAVLGLDASPPVLRVMLPVGISFYTFQELSYTIGVYRGTVPARRDFLDFATFVCFFPQLVAGPIERAAHLLPQVESDRRFDWNRTRDAVVLILWGYFKKLVVADNVGVIANKVFALSDASFPVLWAGVFAFGIQIYADFSAYSDIARGTARCLGFDLIRNFRHPYLAAGPADFWHRWHISLSSWFRDYVYIPLGGSRRGDAKTVRNIMVTFLLSGLWHGASWNYVMWGAYHGVLLVIARLCAPLAPASATVRALARPLQIAGMFALVNVGWLMFRETDTARLLHDFTLSPAAASRFDAQMGTYLFLLAAIYSLPLWIDSLWEEFAVSLVLAPMDGSPAKPGRLAAQMAIAGVLFAAVVVFHSRQSLDFIYFHF
jgi:alginate O-acetyltransferase complex protein AlgI